MHSILLQIVVLLTISFLLIVLSKRLQIAYPLLLVIAGLAVSYIPGMPVVSIDPELVFLIFLPPLLYEAAWWTSWKLFWKWKRPIALLALGLVVCTSGVVAYASVWLIPGFALATGFLLGGIISPPDAIAATTVLKNLKLPKRILAILEGESLVNDASSLIVFRFALAAILTGQFTLQDAATSFFTASAGGIVTGLIIAHVFYAIHRFLPTTPSIDSAFTIIAPYAMYLTAEQFHFSGVLAVVSGGLFLSFRSHEIFVEGQSRLQANGVWATLGLMLNGLIFILIGLELPYIVHNLDGYQLAQAWKYGFIIAFTVIIVRLLWVYPGTFIPRLLVKSIRRAEPHPGWKGSLIIGWAGMRGVVSLAAALSLPMVTGSGAPFPHRSLIIFITFVVILVTLVFQGITLPFLVKKLDMKEIDPVLPDEVQEAGIRLRLTQVAIALLNDKYQQELTLNELVGNLQKMLHEDLLRARQLFDADSSHAAHHNDMKNYKQVLADIYRLQRKELSKIRREKLYDDAIIRGEEMQVDLAEARLGTGH